jgi:hypothetical protein
VVAGIVTAFACTAMIAVALTRRGPARAVALRARAEAYEAALTLVLQSADRPPNRAEWRRVRARLLLWGSGAVIDLFSEIQEELPMDPGDLEQAAGFVTLIQAMRTDLGQRGLQFESASTSEEEQQ